MKSLSLLAAPYSKPLKVIRMQNLSADAELVLEQLGLFPGATIEKLHVAPLGDPVTIRLGGQSFALQKSVCGEISVELSV